MCVRCEVDDEVELEIPCLNFIEEFGGLWEPEADGSTNVAYGGIRLVMPKGVKGLLRAIFPRLEYDLLYKLTQMLYKLLIFPACSRKC